jgi:UDP-glucose 4-epimerase
MTVEEGTSLKSVLVWGATGFIGQHLVGALVERQIPVLALTRQPLSSQTHWNHPLVRWMSIPEGDAGIEHFAAALQQAEVVFNLVGSSGAVASNLQPSASLDANCHVQTRFLQACELSKSKPHVVFASSRLVYGTPDSLPVKEDCLLRPRSFYAAHKVALEHYHQIAALRSVISFTICRISNPYGSRETRPGHWRGFIDSLIEKGCRGIPMEIYGDGRQLRDYIYIDDLTAVLYSCGVCPKARNEIFNIGYGESLPILEAAQLISDCTGTSIVHRPWDDEAALVESGDYVVDVGKAQRLLGFRPRFSFDTTVRELIRSRRESGVGKPISSSA